MTSFDHGTSSDTLFDSIFDEFMFVFGTLGILCVAQHEKKSSLERSFCFAQLFLLRDEQLLVILDETKKAEIKAFNYLHFY
jgi:uncharacterized membrane protein